MFKGLENLEELETAEIPEEWLKLLNEKYLTEEEKQQIELEREKQEEKIDIEYLRQQGKKKAPRLEAISTDIFNKFF